MSGRKVIGAMHNVGSSIRVKVIDNLNDYFLFNVARFF
jgi:hypothetical protein